MQTRTKKGKNLDPRRALLDVRGRSRLEKDSELNKSLAKLMTALMCMHSSQTRETQLAGPGSAAVIHGIKLILDEKGVNDELLGELAKEGISAPAALLRKFLKEAAAAIDKIDVRAPPPEGKVWSTLAVLDNADFHLLGAVRSVVPYGDILIGYEDKEEARIFDEKFIAGLPLPSDEMASRAIPTAEDDAEARETILHQNMLALLNAVHLMNTSLSDEGRSIPLENASEWNVGDDVMFRHRHEERTGVIRNINGDDI